MRRVLLALPGAVVLVVAGLLFAHGATWSLVVGGILGVGGVGAVAVGAAGRGAFLLGLVGALLLCLGTAAATSGLWLVVVGRDAVATVTHVHSYVPPKSLERVDDDTVVLPDGSGVPGPLHRLRHGSLQDGDRVAIVYDPTGLVRFPTEQGDPKNTRDAIGGPVAMVVGFGLQVFTRARSRRPERDADPSVASSG